MAKCERGLWPALSSSTPFRRKLLETVICGRRGVPSSSDPPNRITDHHHRRLFDLLKAESVEAETTKKTKVLEEFQTTVKTLQSEYSREAAAIRIRALAKDNADARTALAALGAVPPLVAALDSDDPGVRIAALYALLNLGIGNAANKAETVEAGAVEKMMDIVRSGCSEAAAEAVVANLLSLSALDRNKPIIGACGGAIAFLANTFTGGSKRSQARSDALRSLFNLSIYALNVPRIVEQSDLVPALLAAVGDDTEASGRVLSVLSNLVTAAEGRRAVSRLPDAMPILVDVLSWSDSSECQEKAAYVLMVMAHKGYKDRTAMTEAGIVSPLLELTLIGSPLAQKRASRILDFLDKGKQMAVTGCCVPPVSAPFSLNPNNAVAGVMEEEGMSEETKAVKELVQQSLQSNMRRIVRRANLPYEFDFLPSDRFRTVTAPSSSKSLPF